MFTYRNIKKAQDDALKLYSGDGDPNAYLLQSYDFYVTEYYKQVDELRSIVATPDDAGNLQSEDDIRAFVIAFRTLAGILSTLKTFSKFDWADLAPTLDEDEYADFKSWYLYYYDKHKGGDKESVLVDVDFNIELVRTDKINVVYILNLLKDINRKDENEMKKSVDLILREIERSDNEKIQHFRGGKLHFVIQTADGLTFGEHDFGTALFLDLFSHFFDAPCCKFGASVHRRKRKITCALLGQTSVPHFPKIELKRAKFGKSGISVCLLENLEFLLAS